MTIAELRSMLPAIFLIASAAVGATSAEAPAAAETLFRAVSYDRNLGARTPKGLRLGIVFDADVPPSARDAGRFASEAQALRSSGSELAPIAISKGAFEGETHLIRWLMQENISVLYVSSGMRDSRDAVIRAAENAGVLTLGSSETDVAEGLVAGVNRQGDQTKLVINMGAAARSGVDFDPVVRQIAMRVGTLKPLAERGAIEQAVADYASAIRGKDLDALRRVWPSLTKEEAARVKTSFSAVRSHDVLVAVLGIEVEGTQARARIRRTDRLVTNEGGEVISSNLMDVVFSGDGSAFVITSMSKAAARAASVD